MPQMFPLNWIFLFYFFIIIMLLFNIFTYYNNINYNKNLNKIYLNIKKINWKW